MLPDESDIAAFAIRAHKDQRYGERPYASHLIDVVENLRRFGVDTRERVAAAWLHDTVEDTAIGLDEVRSRFGERVAELVSAVTTSEGGHRKERLAKTYPRIAATEGAIYVKLADRIANVESCWASRDRRLFMYKGEYPAFRAALRVEGEATEMWAHLDRLLAYAPSTAVG